MKELKEIRIGDDRLALKDNLVKTSILPQNSKEIFRNVVIQGDVIVEGSTFAYNLEIENGPAQFNKSVYTHNELHIRNDVSGKIIFQKAVASAQSVVALSPKAKIIFGADINAKTIKLRNAFVAANIFAEEIQLENCVVLGGVFASKNLKIDGCIVGTFNSPAVRASLTNYLLYPSAFSVEPINILPGTSFFNLTLADLGSLYCGKKEKHNTGKIPIDVLHDTQRTVLVDGNQNTMLVQSYSVANKVLVADMINIDKLENHFLLTAASLGSQLLRSYSIEESASKKTQELNLENISEFFFSILQGKTSVNDLAGEFSLEEIQNNFKA